jgi:hypothetical protein
LPKGSVLAAQRGFGRIHSGVRRCRRAQERSLEEWPALLYCAMR